MFIQWTGSWLRNIVILVGVCVSVSVSVYVRVYVCVCVCAPCSALCVIISAHIRVHQKPFTSLDQRKQKISTVIEGLRDFQNKRDNIKMSPLE